ncbi:hypothetical protein, partial [Mycobacterium tuberculosis]|uniref:hypothetical protein n=1 Tax=Mycobacterium tuberculosis TaxID=1773 RepID=UPI003DA7A8C6
MELLVAKGGNENDRSTIHLLPLKLPTHVAGLRKLRFANGLFYPHASTFSAMRRFLSVHELSLFHVSFHSLADLRRIISS